MIANQIHVGLAPGSAEQLARDPSLSDYTRLHLDLAEAQDRASLMRILGEEFKFPYPVMQLDAAVDLMVAPEESSDRLLLVVDGVDQADETVAGDLLHILPLVVDRWRSGNGGLIVLVVDGKRRGAIRDSLAKGNEFLEEFAKNPWVHDTAPVPVIDHAPIDRSHHS